MNTNALNEIADLATILAAEMPEAAEKLRSDRENVAECRGDEVLGRFASDAQHAVNCRRELCHELRGEMDRLADLVYLHLPEVDLNFCRRSPGWYPEDAGADWAAITAELRLVQATARRKLLAGDDGTAIPPVWSEEIVAELKQNQKELAQAMNAAGGDVEIAELAKSFGWSTPCDDSINSLVRRFNVKLKSLGVTERVHRHDGTVRVRPPS